MRIDRDITLFAISSIGKRPSLYIPSSLRLFIRSMNQEIRAFADRSRVVGPFERIIPDTIRTNATRG